MMSEPLLDREKLDRATKHTHARARRERRPITWKKARELAAIWLAREWRITYPPPARPSDEAPKTVEEHVEALREIVLGDVRTTRVDSAEVA